MCVCVCACENGTWLVNIVTYVCLHMHACRVTDWVFAGKSCFDISACVIVHDVASPVL